MNQPVSHPASLSESLLLRQCDVTRQRRTGPGGQHRNKVETAIRLTHRPTGFTAEANERRSQAANLSAAVRRLRLTLAVQLRHPRGIELSSLWRCRCRQGLVSINKEHDEFPALLAEALDHLAGAGWNTAEASGRLGCHTSQLVKLLRMEPRALGELNRHRAVAGLRPLK